MTNDFGLAPLKQEGVTITDGIEYFNPGDPGFDEMQAEIDARKARPIYGDAQSDAIHGGEGVGAYEPNVVAEDLVRINESGIVPTEFKVLVLPDESETQIRARRSNIAVPEAYAAQYAHGSVTGTIIAMSPAAFSYHDWPAGCRIPLVGERIVFARYAGMLVAGKPVRNERGHDEPREYRLLNDKDVVAVLEF